MPGSRLTPRLAAVAALLLLTQAAAADGADGPGGVEVSFRAPAQAGPGVAALDAAWLLVTFGPGGSGAFSLDFPRESRERNVTVFGLAGLDGSPPTEVPAESARTLPGFGAEARFPDGLASLYLQGSRIRVHADGARADLRPHGPGCLHDLVQPHEELDGEARHRALCPPGGGAFVSMHPEAGGRIAVRVEAEGLEVVEYHHAAVSCHGGAACPGGGERREWSQGPPGLGVRNRVLGYERLESSDARVAGSGHVGRVLAGGPSLDLAVQGWVRLPVASLSAPCEGCAGPDGETLHAEGNLTLSGLRPHPEGLSASLGGDLRSARLDERGIDPGLLRGIGLAGASAAAVAATAWGARALAALFSRIPDAGALEHPRRRLLMEAIRQNPGIHVRALARLAGGGPTLAQYHVRVLVRSGLVVQRARGRHLCLFESCGGGRPGGDWAALTVLREEPLLRLHGLVASRPGLPRRGIVEEARVAWGWSPRTTYHRLRRLEGVGLVQPEGPEGGLHAVQPPAGPMASAVALPPTARPRASPTRP